MADMVSAEVVAMLGGSSSICQLLPEQEEGPYRRGEQPHRRDVTEGRVGSPLRVGLRLRGERGDPVAGSTVEIWHCDAQGRYSGYPPNDPDVAVDAAPQRAEYLVDETFLRGRQITDARGDVEFHTIYPGWYPGRTVHVHLMVQTSERTYTSQVYFPEAVTAAVFAVEPYRHRGLPDTTHATDGIFPTGGDPAVLDFHHDAGGNIAIACLALPDR